MTDKQSTIRKRFVAELGVKLDDRSVVASITSISVDRDGDVLIHKVVMRLIFLNLRPCFSTMTTTVR